MTGTGPGGWWRSKVEKWDFTAGNTCSCVFGMGWRWRAGMEMDLDWYVIMSEDARFDLKKKQTYWVET